MRVFLECHQIVKAYNELMSGRAGGYIFEVPLRDILDREKVLESLRQFEEACRSRGIDTTGKTLGELKEELAKHKTESFG